MKTTNGLALNSILVAILAICFVLSPMIGSAHFDVLSIFNNSKESEAAKIILFEIRLPRTIIAMFGGGSLALCGAVLQSYLRNPLADSGVLGISAFASMGAIIAIYFGLSAVGFWLVPVIGIVMALVSLLLLLFLVGKGGTIIFILAGVVLSSIAGGLIALFLSLAPNPYALSEMIDWQIGGFADVSNNEITLVLPLIILGIGILLRLNRSLSAFTLGDETAQSLGVNIKSLRLQIMLGVGLIVGAVSSVCGIISFVGLIVPHLMRPLVKNNPRNLLFPSLLFGAAFTLLADILIRLNLFGFEIKLGVIMTLMGAPFFLYLLLNLRRRATL